MEIDFEHRSTHHCENGVTSNLLRFYGYDYSESLIFGLSAGLYFVHVPLIKSVGFPVTVFRPMPGVIFTRVMKSLDFKFHTRIFINKKNAVKKLDSLLEQGIPTGCVINMYNLHFLPLEYRLNFNGHNVCVIGKDGDNYLISDSFIKEKATISSQILLDARFAKGIDAPRGKLYWIKSLPEKAPDLNKLVRKAILKNCYYMLYQSGMTPFVGINAIKYLGNRIPKYPKKYGERKAALHLLHLFRMTEIMGTGGAGFRFLYATFLQEAAEITGISELNDFSQRMTAIGDQWRVFASEAGRINKNRSSVKFDYQTIGDYLKEIGKQEELFFKDLENLIKKHSQK